jgi:hypothetical protein
MTSLLPVSMTKFFTQFKELLFWPFVFAVSPHFVRLKILRFLESSHNFQAEATNSMLLHLPNFLPHSDPAQAAHTLRRILLIDAADVFFSLFRSKRSLHQWVTCKLSPPIGPATLILSAHRGNGWWILPQLAAQGEPVRFVIAPPANPNSWVDYFFWPLKRLRWFLLNRTGGAPLIQAHGATQVSREVFSQKGRVLALIDLPPAVARSCKPLSFFSRTAYMPRRLIDLAVESGAHIYYCRSDVNPENLKVHIEYERIDSHLGAQAVFETYAKLLEADICAQPGSWHAWGHVDLFFQEPVLSPNVRETA